MRTLSDPAPALTGKQKIVCWIFQVVAALILLQTLYFKFTGAPESVYIFTTLGVEPWGRIATGLVELVAGVLLLIPRTAVLGALLALGVVSGAILSHLAVLGIALTEVGDGGELFALALVVFVASAIVVYWRRAQIPVIGARLSS